MGVSSEAGTPSSARRASVPSVPGKNFFFPFTVTMSPRPGRPLYFFKFTPAFKSASETVSCLKLNIRYSSPFT